MYTQCPECKKQHKITIDELSDSRGMICCDECSVMFDALELLSEGQDAIETSDILTIPEIKPGKKNTPLWGLGFSLCFIVFIFQIVYFEGYNLSQNADVRPWLEKTCGYIDCQLPRYKNLDELTILHGSFEPIANKNYVFKAAFTNQSAFEQTLPSIKLTLLDFTGQAFAKRIFHPQDYSNQAHKLIEPEMSEEIIMEIATPSKKTGGYRFEFI
ncbi:MAG: hypothetical protein DRQ43_09455 [Gammaproteobacteria bacterium]|nr:MAG: hypothetical protein DRQ43_09455 [Gammaproteobacteria bacterium]